MKDTTNEEKLIKQMKKIIKDINKKLNNNEHKGWFVIAIDGNCGSGKTTFANALSKEFDCDVIHMDDFFLPVELRSPERLNEIAGNVHYERFENQVIKGIETGQINYMKFDCKVLDYVEEIKIRPNNVLIVEGSYSFSHGFYNAYDYKIFLKCDYDIQLDRIAKRAGESKLEMFKELWIPMENKYFNSQNLNKIADIVIDTSDGF